MAHGSPRINLCLNCDQYIWVNRFSPNPICPDCGEESKQSSKEYLIKNYWISFMDAIKYSFQTWIKITEGKRDMSQKEIDINETPYFADVAKALEKSVESKPIKFNNQFEQNLFYLISGYIPDHHTFLEELRQIMPPTCTINERNFLYKIRGKFTYIPDSKEDDARLFGGDSVFYQFDFEDTNLSELVEKEDVKVKKCVNCDSESVNKIIASEEDFCSINCKNIYDVKKENEFRKQALIGELEQLKESYLLRSDSKHEIELSLLNKVISLTEEKL